MTARDQGGVAAIVAQVPIMSGDVIRSQSRSATAVPFKTSHSRFFLSTWSIDSNSIQNNTSLCESGSVLVPVQEVVNDKPGEEEGFL